MKNARPSLKDIDRLLAFMPRLCAPEFSPIVRWRGGERTADGAIQMPWPEYDEVVRQFFRLAAASRWNDFEYRPEVAGAMVQDREVIRDASLDQIKTMLTYCVREERFADGHWAEMIEDGVICAILDRLKVLRTEVAKTS